MLNNNITFLGKKAMRTLKPMIFEKATLWMGEGAGATGDGEDRSEMGRRAKNECPAVTASCRIDVSLYGLAMTDTDLVEESYAADPINASLTAEEKIGFYRDMVRIRRFEQTTLSIYQKGKIGGFLHLYIGQESLAVGAVSLMGENDHVITAYRDHGHALAVGMSMNECAWRSYTARLPVARRARADRCITSRRKRISGAGMASWLARHRSEQGSPLL